RCRALPILQTPFTRSSRDKHGLAASAARTEEIFNMRWWVRTIAGVCLVAAVSAPAAPQATRPAAAKWVSGFYVGYMADIYPPSAIDFGSLTHVMVFSVRPQRNGTLDTALFIDRVNGPRTAQDVATRAHAAGRKAILVIGGSDTQAGFTGATSSENLSTFV